MELREEELVKRAIEGDEIAFGFLVAKYREIVHALSYRRIGDYHDAEDVTQEVFIRVYQKLPSLRNPESFTGWLYVITENCCRMYLRRRNRSSDRTMPLEEVSEEQWNALSLRRRAEEERRRLVRDTIAELPETERIVVTLYYMGGMSCKDIARFMGTSLSAIKNRLYRARKRLREGMSEMAGIERITLSGKVLKDNAPVHNAQIYLLNKDMRMAERVSVTSSNGSFQFEMPKPRRWDRVILIAYHPQYSLGWKGLTGKEAGSVVIDIEMDDAEMITGTVVDSAGKPIADAEIRVYLLDSPIGEISGDIFILPPFRVKTNENGEFVLRNLPKESRICFTISAVRYGEERIFGIQAGATGTRFTLKREGRIEGRITYGDTGRPAEGIVVYTQGIYSTPGWGETRTDENGHFVFTNLPPGHYNVFIGDLPDWTAVAREKVKVEEGETVGNVNLRLVRGGFIVGRVTDKETGEPIPNCGIALHDAAWPESQAAVRGTTTDENGYYRFRAAPGKAKVYPSIPKGYQPVTLERYVDVVEGKTVSGVDFQLLRGTELSGRVVTSKGRPMAGVKIIDRRKWWEIQAVSDKDGRFTISGVRPGQKLSLKAELKEKRLRGYANVEVQPGDEVKILLEEYETTSVSGRVVDGKGKPITGANIQLTRWDTASGFGLGSNVAITDSSGRFEITDLIVGDEYRISAGAEGYGLSGTDMFIAQPNMSPFEDIVLPKADRYLEGIVTDTDGKPIAGARVVTNSELSGCKETLTDEGGCYRLDNLAAVVETEINIFYRGYGYHGGSRFRYIPTNQTYNFTLIKADKSLSGKVTDPEGVPIQGASVLVEGEPGSVVKECKTDALGRFQFQGLVNERENIMICHREYGSKRFENVKTNQEDLLFVLRKEEKVKRKCAMQAGGRLKDLDGNPAPELDVEVWLNGEPLTLDEIKGKIAVLSFWSSQSRRCMEAIRLLNALHDEFGDRGVIFIGIHEHTEEINELKRFIEEKGCRYKIAVDKRIEEAKGVTFDRYGVDQVPRYILIDREGKAHTKISDYSLEGKILLYSGFPT